MKRPLVDDAYYSRLGKLHFNVRYMGGLVCNGVMLRHFEKVAPESIDWAWIVEEGRCATPSELKQLCAEKFPPIRLPD